QSNIHEGSPPTPCRLEWAPAVQVLHGLPIFPLDEVFERVRQRSGEYGVRQIGHAAMRAHGYYDALAVESVRVERFTSKLCLQVAGQTFRFVQRNLRQRRDQGLR